MSGEHGRRRLRLEVDVASDEEVAALRSALLSARATELGEVRRRDGRLSYGYGSESARESMSDELTSRRLRWEMLDRLIEALDRTPR